MPVLLINYKNLIDIKPSSSYYMYIEDSSKKVVGRVIYVNLVNDYFIKVVRFL